MALLSQVPRQRAPFLSLSPPGMLDFTSPEWRRQEDSGAMSVKDREDECR